MPRAREHESEEGVWGGQSAGVEARASAVGRWRGRPRRGRGAMHFCRRKIFQRESGESTVVTTHGLRFGMG